MFIDQNHVRTAVARLGGPTKVSNLLNVSNGAVHAWIKAANVPNIDLAKKLAELAGMQVSEVRPTR